MKYVISLNQHFIILFFVKNVYEPQIVSTFIMKLKFCNIAAQLKMNDSEWMDSQRLTGPSQ